MFNPISTYRIQFHQNFTFEQLENIIPYLQQLGVGTLYASPVFTAVPGSTHGYDAVDPLAINPEIGTDEDLRRVRKKLEKAGIAWLQDIVPNHMAYDHRNQWLMDVLEKGDRSLYVSFFDTAGTSPMFKGKIMVPFLGNSLDDVIEKGELSVSFKEGRLVVKYFDSWYPLRIEDYTFFLEGESAPLAVQNLHDQITYLKALTDSQTLHEQWAEIRIQLAALFQNADIQKWINKRIETTNKNKEKIRQLTAGQHYRLCHWQETDNQINYRRFFTVNGLICVNIQDEAVLEQHHRLVQQLVNDGTFQGLRIDHIDGLYNPTEYLERLRRQSGDDTYIVVEKILEPGENLPDEWPIQGNTGYDFLAMVNNLFTYKKSETAFTEYYGELTGNNVSIHQQIRNKKAHILENHMCGELDNLYRLFIQLNLTDKRHLARIPADDLKAAIGEFMIQCPVYRFYGDRFPLSRSEESAVRNILNSLRHSGESNEAVNVLETVLLNRPYEKDHDLNQRIAIFYQRIMQFTGPLMAKGVEDTLMYTYNRFIGHNEVGDSPETFGDTPEGFHQKMQQRQQNWPLSINGTSTHDTKRGEDARARLNVLTDLHEVWLATVEEWRQLNAHLKAENAPDDNDEYFIYQVLAGNTPMPGEADDDFANRLKAYLPKALREAKQHSNWSLPNESYETAAITFAQALLQKDTPFWKSFTQFQQQITDHGIINSLSQLVLKFTCPGVPDVYQGCEFWDFSMVDPDNRRPVDYSKREKALKELDEMPESSLLAHLWENRYNSTIKLWLTKQLMELRKTYPDLFVEGEYIPLHVEGTYKNHVLAFARRYKNTVQVIAVPLHTAVLCKEQGVTFFKIDWKDTHIHLNKDMESHLDLLFTHTALEKGKGLLAAELFQHFPVAILRGRQEINERGAGILLHISSLPSPFGIGDMGPEAKRFADFLYRTKQKYWQLLPLNPTEEGQGHSPYSALSSKAGYPLLISPELLAKEGLLPDVNLSHSHLPADSHADFAEAEKVKNVLFDNAFETFLKAQEHPLHAPFNDFLKTEKEWLDDFALFMLLKKVHKGKPWFLWPDEYKKRDEEALKKLVQQHPKELKKIKWLQFVFARQWHHLRTFCNSRNIRFIGDLPFYISYDSSDVWAAKELFAIDDEGYRTGMAGVPPDAFSDDGQLWGMPVFNWEVMQANQYHWWTTRLQKNIELYDLVRLDHFRAFSAYWVVAEGEKTARNGKWMPGPGSHFFEAMERALGQLPFVAEDLGDIDQKVLNLRDEFRLPGMKVLQFAFGEDLPQSDYIPHNYEKRFLVYTGTHDNNTTIGWYKTELTEEIKAQIRQYVGTEVNEGNIHDVLARMAYSSVATIAILPIQDILGLDEKARMNVPASAQDNWTWRLTPKQISQETEKKLLEWTRLYNRD